MRTTSPGHQGHPQAPLCPPFRGRAVMGHSFITSSPPHLLSLPALRGCSPPVWGTTQLLPSPEPLAKHHPIFLLLLLQLLLLLWWDVWGRALSQPWVSTV